MACFRPLLAYQTTEGEVFFYQRGTEGKSRNAKAPNWSRELVLPCGRCLGCRVRRGQEHAMRCMHEAQMHDLNCFITLTYDDEFLPQYSNLHYPDFQKFMKRLREKMKRYKGGVGVCELLPIKFFACGEYGERFSRPHYHACLFGVDFPDKQWFKQSESGADVFTSDVLKRLWPFGHSTVGNMTFESAAYVAGYCTKKVVGSGADAHYQRIVAETGEIVKVEPEFGVMSQGLGKSWFAKFHGDVVNYDHVIVSGRKLKPPRYYDKLLSELDPFRMEDIQFERQGKMVKFAADCTEDRLAVREAVLRAKFNQKQRNGE